MNYYERIQRSLEYLESRLEEHLGFDEDANHVGGVDLYMPISERSTS